MCFNRYYEIRWCFVSRRSADFAQEPGAGEHPPAFRGGFGDAECLGDFGKGESTEVAQLHQLRGRVGRSSHQSYCYLVVSSSKAPSQRLKEVEKSNDGFYLAEVDLKLRGPGEIYGRAQHGELNMQVASLGDTRMIRRAQKAAQQFVELGMDLVHYTQLQKDVQHYQRVTTLN